MSDFSPIFSELVFRNCGLVRNNSDLDFKFSEDVGNLNDIKPNKIYKDLSEYYELIVDNSSKFPLKYKFSDVEIDFQKLISINGELSVVVEANWDSEQIWSIELSLPTKLNEASSPRKSLTVSRTQQMLKPYGVDYETFFEESFSKEDFDKIAFAYSLKY